MNEVITFGPCQTPDYARDLGCRICWKELGDTIALEVNNEQCHATCYDDHKQGHNGDVYTHCGFCWSPGVYGTTRTVARPD